MERSADVILLSEELLADLGPMGFPHPLKGNSGTIP